VLRADPTQASAAFTTADAELFMAANPHATVTIVEGASHMLHDEQPERFLAEVERFVSA
jgi:pimeloyl-ACP methyl ester carboxylesterase